MALASVIATVLVAAPSTNPPYTTKDNFNNWALATVLRPLMFSLLLLFVF